MSDSHARGGTALRQTFLACAALLMAGPVPVASQETESAASAGPRELFTAALPDVPGTHLEVVELVYPPRSGAPSAPEDSARQGHHHPGSVYLYVTEGAIRIGVEGQAITIVEQGGSFFEPPHAHHMFTESASASEGARVIAVMLVPDDEPSVIRGRPEPRVH